MIFGLQAFLTFYENAYRIIPMVTSADLGMQLRQALRQPCVERVDTMLELCFSSLGAPLTEKLLQEIREQEGRWEEVQAPAAEGKGASSFVEQLSGLPGLERLAELIRRNEIGCV